MNFVLIAGGLVVVFLGADWLVRGAGGIAARAGLPRFVVGLTVVSLGTSAPELFVAADSALRGAGDLVLGNILGSNLANLGLILGLTALIRPVAVHVKIIRRDLPFMIAVTLLLFPVLSGGSIGRLEGGLLVAAFLLYLLILFLPDEKELPDPAELGLGSGSSAAGEFGLAVVGCVALTLGAEALVTGALDIARSFGVSELVVGLTLVAVGTSIPELATSAVAAYKGETGIALGNVVGSNIANTTLVLGSAALLRPVSSSTGVVGQELPFVLLLSALALPLAWTELRLQRWEGGLLLGSYAALTVWLFLP